MSLHPPPAAEPGERVHGGEGLGDGDAAASVLRGLYESTGQRTGRNQANLWGKWGHLNILLFNFVQRSCMYDRIYNSGPDGN